MSSSVNKSSEYNILLLGETGVGKSTTINALANYLKFNSFNEALSSDLEHLIPSKFMLPSPTTLEPVVISTGDCNDDITRTWYSTTKSPTAYCFQFDDRIIRIIDTPGVGDLGGVGVDKENFDEIISCLKHYQTLHGIVVFVKSTETRKNAYFRYCINELLIRLHKNALKNIVFCFTFSRITFYGPGDGYYTLKSFLEEELSSTKLTLKPGINCFFIDNEAYRFLVALKQGYPFLDHTGASYNESWNKSAKQITIMFNQITLNIPHNIEKTLSLNEARNFILELAGPILEITNIINSNIDKVKCAEKELKIETKYKERLVGELNYEVDSVEVRPLDYPRMVCTDNRCVEIMQVNGKAQVLYKTMCHANCTIPEAEEHVVGHPSLRNCSAFNGGFNCNICGCPWHNHMYIRTEYIKIKQKIFDSNKIREIETLNDKIDRNNQLVKALKITCFEYENEYKVIEDILSKFAYFLNKNSTSPFNHFIEPYLALLIEEELKKREHNYPADKYESLKAMQQAHKTSVQLLQEAIKTKQMSDIKLSDISLYIDVLFSLKHSGPQFRNMIKTLNAIKNKGDKKLPEVSLQISQNGFEQAKKNSFWKQFWN